MALAGQPSPLPSPRQPPVKEALAQGVAWIPDEEVNDCPICHRRFATLSLRKHHCRKCGRVVCGSCSDNTVQLPGSSSRQRVCDPCFQLQAHDKAATLTEDISNNRQAEAVLKANLRDKHEQAAWFGAFLRRVAAPDPAGDGEAPGSSPASASEPPGAAPAPGPAGEAAAPSAASSAAPSAAGSPGGAERRCLEARARQRWGQVCAELREARAAAERQRGENLAVDAQRREREAEVSRLRQVVRSLDSDVRDCPRVVSERDQLAQKTRTLQQELDGLTQRTIALQADRPALGSFSFSSFSNAGSFINLRDGRDGGACTDRCRRCAVM